MQRVGMLDRPHRDATASPFKTMGSPRTVAKGVLCYAHKKGRSR